MRVKELKRCLERYDIDDIFKVIQFPVNVDVDALLDNGIPVQPLLQTKDLLDNWDQVTENDVVRHVKFLRLYGQVWDLQNLDWSLELLENSCSVYLSNKSRKSYFCNLRA